MKNSNARILVLTATFPRWPGDVEPAFIFDLCREFVTAGLRVTVLAPHAPGARERETIDGIEVRRFRYAPERLERLAYVGGIMANLKRSRWLYGLLPLYLLAQFLALVRCLRAVRFDAVHAHWIVPQGMLLVAARPFAAGRPRCVCVAHGSDVNALRGRFWAWLRRGVAARCDRMVAVSEALRGRLAGERCPTEKITVIPMGTNLESVFVPDGSPRAPAELLFVGRLVDGKGLDVLLRALPAIRKAVADARLTVIGVGPRRAAMEQLAAELGVSSKVDFAGALPHAALPDRYRRATLLVLPSRQEGFGLVAVEAMGCGCPVLASDLPTLADLVDDGDTGRLFRVGDAADLARVAIELLTSPQRAEALAEAARRRVLARFDWRAVATRHVATLLPAGTGAADV